ncbi:hypothetical protein ACHAXN_001002 [Cyclotella atomus]
MSEPEQLKDIITPHAHDVLSGRGNFVNHHGGNENFRALVKKHKKEYVACPKAQKPMYSILIYDEIRSMDPPGRFLKQDPTTKLWSDIGKKKALDKTRQALREGAPEMLKELGGGEEEDEVPQKQSKRRREDNPLNSSFMSNVSIGSFTVDGMNNPSPDLFSQFANQGQGVGNTPGAMGINLQNLQGADMNQLLMTAQMQLLQQQMQQWQQVINAQNNLNQGNQQLDPNTQLQLLSLQLQLQNQMGQQQNVPAIPNFFNPQAQVPALNMPLPAPQPAAGMPQPQLNEQNLAALLTALQSAAPQNAMPNGLPPVGTPSFQNVQNQMAMMQLNNQINQANASLASASANPSRGGSANNIENILSAADAVNDNGTNQEMTDSAMPLQNNERKPGGTSLARSQRIGLKNSFTRRPNSHRQAANPLAHSLMSVDSLNLDDDEEENAEDKSANMQEDV